jgi:cell division protease FtsH
MWRGAPDAGRGLGEQHVFHGREFVENRKISEEMLDRAEGRLLNDALERAKAVLNAHRDKLDLLADTLMDETIGEDKISALIGAPARPTRDMEPALAAR